MRLVLRLKICVGTMAAQLVRRGSIVWAAEASFEDAEDLGRAIGELAGRSELPSGTRVDVLLEPPLAQHRLLGGLPPVSARALRALVDHQAGRYFRKNGKPLATDAAWIGPRRREGRMARAVAVEAHWLDAIADAIRGSRFRLGFVRAGCEGSPLVPESRAGAARRSLRERRTTRALAIAGTFVWLLSGLYAATAAISAAGAVDDEIARLSEPAKAAAEARRTMNEARAAVAAVREIDALRGFAVARLAAIARALPDRGYLVSIEWDSAGSGLVAAAAPSAADLVARLEAAHLAQPRLEGTAVREADVDGVRERFSVRFGRKRDP